MSFCCEVEHLACWSVSHCSKSITGVPSRYDFKNDILEINPPRRSRRIPSFDQPRASVHLILYSKSGGAGCSEFEVGYAGWNVQIFVLRFIHPFAPVALRQWMQTFCGTNCPVPFQVGHHSRRNPEELVMFLPLLSAIFRRSISFRMIT